MRMRVCCFCHSFLIPILIVCAKRIMGSSSYTNCDMSTIVIGTYVGPPYNNISFFTAMTPSRHRACHFRLLTASPPRLHSMQPGREACLLLNGKEGPSLPLSYFLHCIDSLIRPLFPGQASFSPWAHRICKRKGVRGGAHGVPTYRERLCRAGPARPAEVQRVTVAG